ncbi:MAG: hypothetical protein R2834_20420 [Rhodothermales bacterium]
MNKLWWSLPSPATFIEEVVSQIRRGNNTVLALPDHLPPGIEFACRAPLGLDWAWEHVEARPIDAPQRHIQSQYLSGNDVAPKHIAEKLATSRTHRNHIFWLHLTDPSDWLNWVDFVEEYSLVRESQGVRSAAQFVIILQGEAARKLPSEASGIVVRKWRNVISSVDALLHATHLYPKKGPYDIQDQLNIALCASVAMWDPDLAKTIMGDLDDFLKIHPPYFDI